MIANILFIAISATVAECVIAHQFAWWRKMNQITILNILNSLALSWLFGFLYGGGGFYASAAAPVAMLLSIPYNKFAAWWFDGSGQQTYERWKSNWRDLVEKTVRVLELTLRIITFPITAYRWCASLPRKVQTWLPSSTSTPRLSRSSTTSSMG